MTAPRIPLNTFRLIALTLESGSNLIYQELVKDVSTIILSAQITNTTNADKTVTIQVEKASQTPITLVKDATIPPSEALNPFVGKLVLEKGDALLFITDQDNALDTVVSVLENAND
jgi:hypothetical protein